MLSNRIRISNATAKPFHTQTGRTDQPHSEYDLLHLVREASGEETGMQTEEPDAPGSKSLRRYAWSPDGSGPSRGDCKAPS
ncbi:MAG: hypothetical protein RI575_06600 [Balneolaceae bacterium]|nr:hypothetical protein [Balneolaceae bacterium]